MHTKIAYQNFEKHTSCGAQLQSFHHSAFSSCIHLGAKNANRTCRPEIKTPTVADPKYYSQMVTLNRYWINIKYDIKANRCNVNTLENVAQNIFESSAHKQNNFR